MNVLVVYSSQFGNTERLARAIGAAFEPVDRVCVLADGEEERARAWASGLSTEVRREIQAASNVGNRSR